MGPNRKEPKNKVPSAQEIAEEEKAITPDVIQRVGVGTAELADLFLLESIKGFGPQKFRRLLDAQVAPQQVLLDPARLPIAGKTGDRFRANIEEFGPKEKELAWSRAVRQILRAHENKARILTYDSPGYPASVLESNNPIPVLYVRGALEILNRRQAVACVGSREIRPPYDARHRALASFAASEGFVIVSGFATGADRIGHEAALETNGATILVMPCGLDRPFPPENKDLWERFLMYEKATMVSEFPFGTPAAALTLRKRNKLIVSFAQGVLMSQSSAKGGAMNAYRFALEQRKPVATFESKGEPGTSGNLAIAEGSQRPKKGSAEQEPLSPQDAPEKRPTSQATIFSADRDDPNAWSKWLHEL